MTQPTDRPEDKAVDIAIIGGGMVGLSLATMLARANPEWQIVLIEKMAFASLDAPLTQPSFDARSTAISYGSAEILQTMGIWESLRPSATAISQVHVSDRGHFLGANIGAQEYALDAVGYVVPNAALGRLLVAEARAYPNLSLLGDSLVHEVRFIDKGAELEVNTPAQLTRLQARLTVIADGGDSPLRTALGIHHHTRDYGQTAIVCNVSYTEPHKGIAYERFTEQGPLALLPLGGEKGRESALIWTLPHDVAREMLHASDEVFLQELQQRFGYRLGAFTRASLRSHFPLVLVQAEEQVRSNLVLIGNAAHFLHPVAGQGFNLSLRDCAALTETLLQDSRLGDLTQLLNYQATQKRDQFRTIEFSHYLVKLFSSDALGAIAARHLGLLSLEVVPLFKQEFVAQTMGTAGREFAIDTANLNQSFLPRLQQNESLDELFSDHGVTLAQELSHSHYDVIVVGAGLVGAAFACALAESSERHQKILRICVIDAALNQSTKAFETQTPQFDARVVALNQQSQALLDKIGVWDSLAHARVSPYCHMHVWDGEGSAAIDFNARDARSSHLGHIVENSLAVKILHARLSQFSHVDFICDSVVSIAFDKAQAAKVTLASGLTLSAFLLVAADGARSPLRSMASITTREWDYGHTAIVTTVKTEKPHRQTAWQRFTHQGPLAFLPLQHLGDEHYCSIVWSLDENLAENKMTLSDEDFARDLGFALEHKLGRIEKLDKRFAIRLRQCHATEYVRPNFALIGDAAHAIHPLAGQGANLGFADIVALIAEIERAWERGVPLQDYSILRRYQRERMGENLAMMAAMEGFKQLFGRRSTAALLVRNLGMAKVNQLHGLKQWIIRHALGRA